MATFERSIEIRAPRSALFDLTQDYRRRLKWDPFLKEAKLVDGASQPGVGVRAWCVAKTGLGMETEYVSFNPPERTAIKMTRGPAIIHTFAGSWIFKALEPDLTRVTFRYHLTGYPRWLGFVLDPLLVLVFAYDTQKRLQALKHAVENTGILASESSRFS
ncbi:MAG: SRPBCC family protein [Chloroflexi bacterium]|nr:SRPBCC family protein [Chloroflexota bacterium]